MKLLYRTYQWLFCHMQRLVPWCAPTVIEGNESLLKLPKLIQDHHQKKVFIITTQGFIKRGTLTPLFEQLAPQNIQYIVYHDVMPNPTIHCVEEGVQLYTQNSCQAIIAIGGGSVMDCAKIIAARIAKPSQSVEQMKGLFKIHKATPTIYAVPTTAGTGSEVTVAAVITNKQTHYKYAINDTCLVPAYAILDPTLTTNLPAKLTAETGMDALTHAVEAYTNLYSEEKSNQQAMQAVKMIFENLYPAYEDGKNIEVRNSMLKASFIAGQAFTKAYVGYVHAIAHALGGMYNIPHGRANAIILPVVLESYGKHIEHSLSDLAKCIGIEKSSDEANAKAFIQAIKDLNKSMEIPDKIIELKHQDIPVLAARAIKEANPMYPVPEIWDVSKMIEVINKLYI